MGWNGVVCWIAQNESNYWLTWIGKTLNHSSWLVGTKVREISSTC